jgi:hypothetical protein
VQKLDRDSLTELGGAYRSRLEGELQPTDAAKQIDWGILLAMADLRDGLVRRVWRRRKAHPPQAKLDLAELTELGEAYRFKLDEELKPTRTAKEIDWGILLSTVELRRSLWVRFRRMGVAGRFAVILGLLLAAALTLWLLSRMVGVAWGF